MAERVVELLHVLTLTTVRHWCVGPCAMRAKASCGAGGRGSRGLVVDTQDLLHPVQKTGGSVFVVASEFEVALCRVKHSVHSEEE